MWRNSDNLLIGKQRVPLGVGGRFMKQDPMLQQMLPVYVSNLGMLSFCEEVKKPSTQIKSFVNLLQETLSANGYSPYSIQFVDDTSHAVADQMMRLEQVLGCTDSTRRC